MGAPVERRADRQAARSAPPGSAGQDIGDGQDIRDGHDMFRTDGYKMSATGCEEEVAALEVPCLSRSKLYAGPAALAARWAPRLRLWLRSRQPRPAATVARDCATLGGAMVAIPTRGRGGALSRNIAYRQPERPDTETPIPQ